MDRKDYSMVTSFSNPEPIVQEETEKIENDYLSPSKLRDIAGQENLNNVESIKILVNTKDTAIGNFGKYLPSLIHLDLDDSYIPLIRDVGSSLQHLTVLHMSRCHLNDVDGISIMQNLKELYLSSNCICDINPISFLDCLQVLDLQNNKISVVDQIDYLSFMSNLEILFLCDNPVCNLFEKGGKPEFEKFVFFKVPTLQKLNGITLKSIGFADDNCEDEKILDNVEVNARNQSCNLRQNFPDRRPNSKILDKFPSPTPPQKNRPASASGLRSSHDTISTERGSSGMIQSVFSKDYSSFLTFGNRLCGNPMHALKSRKNAPLHPLIVLLSNQEEKNTEAPSPRPFTAVTHRRKFKAISDDQLKVLQANIQNSVVMTESRGDDVKLPESYFKTPFPPKDKVLFKYLLLR